MEQEHKIILFQEKQIRRLWHQEEWFLSVVDVVQVLTDSPNPRNYWNMLKKREPQLYTVCVQLKLPSSDGKKYNTDCANSQGLFRILMAIPSPKAEPMKLWLAQLGKERMAEIENPELAAERARELYRAKGYPEEWIEHRLQSIEIRQQLTAEWKNRGVREGQEYSILTAEIARATFGVAPTEHKNIKGLQKENLRDHMTNLELIFTMLGEESTKQIAINRDAQGFEENHEAAQEGGGVAGRARRDLERRTGQKVVSAANFKKNLPPGEQDN